MKHPITTESRAGTFLVGLLRGLDAQLDAIMRRVLDASDPEAIHDLRVNIRKVRTILKVARAIFGRRHTDHARAAFTVLHRATGALRDEEVFRETMGRLGVKGALFQAYMRRRAARERRLRRATIDLVRGGALDRARRLLGALLTFPAKPSRDPEVGEFARRVVLAARRRVERHRDVDVGDAFGLHELRIMYKELRYPCELLAPVLPKDLSILAGPSATFQSRLGDIHDVDMALLGIARARSLDPALEATLLRALSALRRKKVAAFAADRSPAAVATRPTARSARVRVKRSGASGSGKSRPAGSRRR